MTGKDGERSQVFVSGADRIPTNRHRRTRVHVQLCLMRVWNERSGISEDSWMTKRRGGSQRRGV